MINLILILLILIVLYYFGIVKANSLYKNGNYGFEITNEPFEPSHLLRKPNNNCDINFFLRGNRYYENNKDNFNLSYGDIPTVEQIPCVKQFDWSIPYKTGANNVISDKLWHSYEPRMILYDNCLNCNEFNRKNHYNTPKGISKHDLANVEFYENELSNNIPLTTNRHSLSNPMTTGMQPIKKDCLVNVLQRNEEIGCNGFGEKIYNFH